MSSATAAPARARAGFVAARVSLAAYLFFVGFTVWLPANVSAKVTGLVGIVAGWVADAGIASYSSSAVALEFLANVALFVPIGFLLPLAWPRLKLWQAVLIGGVMSAVIESVQGLMPSRIPAVSDLIANTGGTLVGALVALMLLSLLPRGRRPAERRAA
ncbi:VanZ family protein [Microbacterium sp. MYb66]|jgi:glycopeptide antibiotics resistance protein|uniref:VanZ family protein n=1 Tax=Microbacterium sp. MYb66 TaxID=1848692 RepID=UPI000CFEC43F|nr:VanZ family protein [Microbacterium sp. MYb66]PRA81980.1 teicoplanin resistance protein VanZ [Microbacterium sp. MYb66]